MERLELMHNLFVKALDQKLFLSPLESGKVRRALDLGTGTGACESFATQHSQWMYGTEIAGREQGPWILPTNSWNAMLVPAPFVAHHEMTMLT